MNISLIIPAYNEEKYIIDCLDHVKKAAGNRFAEIIVVDNNSTDDTQYIVSSYAKQNPHMRIRVVLEKNKGTSYARERGRIESKSDILAYIDADTHMPHGWYEYVEKIFSHTLPPTHKGHASHRKQIVGLSGPYVYDDIPYFHQLVNHLFWKLVGYPTYLFTGYMATGGNMVARADALEKIGGFDTAITFYGDDTNLSRRLAEVGKMKFDLKLTMYTSGRRLKGQGYLKMLWIYVLNFLSEAILKKPATKTSIDIR